MLDKLKFWKKDDEFSDLDLDKDLGLGKDRELGLDFPGQENQSARPKAFEEPLGGEPKPERSFDPSAQTEQPQPQQYFQQQQQQPRYSQQPQSQPQQSPQYAQQNVGKELEIISAKIDALRASMEAINHRLNSIEKSVTKETRW